MIVQLANVYTNLEKLSTQKDGWTLDGICQTMRCTDILSFLPFESALFSNLNIDDFERDQTEGTVTAALLASSASDWEVIPNVIEIKEIQISLSTQYDVSGVMYTGRFSGHVNIKDREFEILSFFNDTDFLELEIQGDEEKGFPSLQDLLGFIGEDSLIDPVEKGLKAIGLNNLELTDIKIGIDAGNKRINHLELQGEVIYLNKKFDLYLALPELELRCALAPGNKLVLADLLSHYGLTGIEIPTLTIAEFLLDAQITNKQLEAALTVNEDWEIKLLNKVVALQSLSSDIVLNLAEKKVSGSLGGEVDIAGIQISISGDYAPGGGLTFAGSTGLGEQIPVTKIVDELFSDLDISLPDSVPQIFLSDLDFSLNTKSKDFSFHGALQDDFKIPLGHTFLSLPKASIALARQNSKETAELKAEVLLGGVTFDLDFQFLGDKTVKLTFKMTEEKQLKLSDLITHLLPPELSEISEFLDIEIGNTDLNLTIGTGKFDFDLETEAELDVGDFASLKVSTLAISYAKPEKGKPSDFSLNVDGGIHIHTPLNTDVNLAGSLAVTKEGSNIDMSFTPQGKTAAIHIGEPIPKPLSVDLMLKMIEIQKIKQKQKTIWSFDVKGEIDINNLYAPVAKVIPSKIQINLKLSSQGSASLELDELLKPFTLTIPKIPGPDGEIDLGQMALGIDHFLISIGEPTGFSVDIGLGLPSKLNKVLGVDILKVYDPKHPQVGMINLKLGLDESMNLKAVLLDSPLKSMPLSKPDKNGHVWWPIRLGNKGEYGEIELEVPEFSFNGNSFSASGGFDIKKPLKLPLKPVKAVLKECGLTEAANMMPAEVPIEGIKIINDRGELNVGALKNLCSHLPREVQTLLADLKRVVHKLPLRFKEYLNIEIPKSLSFDIAVDAEGGVKFDVGVIDKKHPIRFMMPGMVGPLPGLNGVTLRGISFGELLSGSLFSLKIDADFDQFDIVTLLGAVLLPEDAALFPPSAQLQRTITIENLWMLIVYETAIPIPIPIFFDDLGIDYVGIEGIRIHTHLGFPQPKLDVKEITKLFNNFKTFFTTRTPGPGYLLPTDKKHEPQGFDLKVILGHTVAKKEIGNSLALPPYLGSKSLDMGYTVISAYDIIAHLLNFCKTVSLNECIQLVDLNYRAGTEHIVFLGMTINVLWVISTPEEFRLVSHGRLKVNMQQAEGVLKVLPWSKVPTKDKQEQGLVILLKGGLTVAKIIKFDVTFGLLGSHDAGFATGFQMRGVLAGFIRAEIGGDIILQPKPGQGVHFALGGHCDLIIGNDTILHGALSVSNNALFVCGSFDLHKYLPILELSGDIKGHITEKNFAFAGDVHLKFEGTTIISGNAEVSNNGIAVHGEFLGAQASFKLDERAGSMIGSIHRRFDLNPAHGPTGYADITGKATIEKSGFSLKIDGKWSLDRGYWFGEERTFDGDINFELDYMPDNIEDEIFNSIYHKQGNKNQVSVFTRIAVGSEGENIWAAAYGGAVWRYKLQWTKWMIVPATLVFMDIAIGGVGTRTLKIWAIVNDGSIFQYSMHKRSWDAVPDKIGGGKFQSISIDYTGTHVVAVGLGGSVWEYNFTAKNWVVISADSTIVDIAVGTGKKRIWAVAADHYMYYYDFKMKIWKPMLFGNDVSTFSRVAIGGAKGNVIWAVAAGGAMWHYNLGQKKWVAVSHGNKVGSFIDVSVGGKNGEVVWAVAYGGAMWRRDIKANQWKKVVGKE